MLVFEISFKSVDPSSVRTSSYGNPYLHYNCPFIDDKWFRIWENMWSLLSRFMKESFFKESRAMVGMVSSNSSAVIEIVDNTSDISPSSILRDIDLIS